MTNGMHPTEDPKTSDSAKQESEVKPKQTKTEQKPSQTVGEAEKQK